MPTVAVTGATGHVGGALVRQLLGEGVDVRALVHRRTAPLDGLDVQVVRGDVRDPKSLAPLMQGVDAVFHLAAWVSLDGDHGGEVTRVNAEGSRSVAEAAAAAGVPRMVHMSSVDALDLDTVQARLDDGTTRVAGPSADAYDRSKALAEEIIGRVGERTGMEVVIVRPTACVGPFDHGPTPLSHVLVQIMRGRLLAVVSGGFDWVDVRDVARTTAAAWRVGEAGRSAYLVGGTRASLEEVANLAADLAGRRPPRTLPMSIASALAPASVAMARLTGRTSRFTPAALHSLQRFPVVDCARAQQDLGHVARPLDQSLRDAAEWFHTMGWLPTAPSAKSVA